MTARKKMSAKRQREVLAGLGGEVPSDGVFNSHEVCKRFNPAEKKVFISYRPQDTGRAYQSAAWQVIRPGFKTDPEGHWRDYGHKTFMVHGRENRQGQLDEAIKWANGRYYGDIEWVKDPFGDYQTKATIDAMNAVIESAVITG